MLKFSRALIDTKALLNRALVYHYKIINRLYLSLCMCLLINLPIRMKYSSAATCTYYHVCTTITKYLQMYLPVSLIPHDLHKLV